MPGNAWLARLLGAVFLSAAVLLSGCIVQDPIVSGIVIRKQVVVTNLGGSTDTANCHAGITDPAPCTQAENDSSVRKTFVLVVQGTTQEGQATVRNVKVSQQLFMGAATGDTYTCRGKSCTVTKAAPRPLRP